ncbi:MAG: hypothetical protein OQK24_14780 [Magnetovibrio sp.]|nr:hypothetical protein [Magnetovibrio sp.]
MPSTYTRAIKGSQFSSLFEAFRLTKIAHVMALAIVFATAIAVPKSWSSPTCAIDVSVSEFITSRKSRYFGSSVSAAYKNFDKDKPFYSFAKDVEATLLEAVQGNLCATGNTNTPISVEITFFRLGMTESEQEIEHLQTALAGVNGSYADVTVDRETRSVKASIIWNPRRMLRDQLIIHGYKFDEREPVFPFVETEFYKFVKTYSSEVVYPFDWVRASELKGTVPEDMYAVCFYSGFTTIIPWESFVEMTIRKLPKASRPGYTALTKMAIERGFGNGKLAPLVSVSGTQNSDIHALFKLQDWVR